MSRKFRNYHQHDKEMLLALSTGDWEKLECVYNTETFLSENSWPTDMIPGNV
jgi:hypothetical protein